MFLKSLLSKLWKHEVKNQPKGYDCKHYYSSSGSTALQSENHFQLLPNCWDDLGGLFFLSPTWKLYHYFLGLKSQQLKATRTILKSCSPSGELFILLSPTQEPIGPLVLGSSLRQYALVTTYTEQFLPGNIYYDWAKVVTFSLSEVFTTPWNSLEKRVVFLIAVLVDAY